MPHSVPTTTTTTTTTTAAADDNKNNNNNTSNTLVSPLSIAIKMSSLMTPPSTPDVIHALEVARESPDGAASDPTVGKILESGLLGVCAKIQAQPDRYIMTRDEFSLFNYFQHRFVGDDMAVAARARFWDNLKVAV